jgi:hypothetical protein
MSAQSIWTGPRSPKSSPVGSGGAADLDPVDDPQPLPPDALTDAFRAETACPAV